MVLLSVSLNGEKMEAKILKKIQERIIKNFLDTIIMAELRNGSISGYDIISYIHNKFGLTSKLRNSILTPLLARKKWPNRRLLGGAKKSLQTNRKRSKNNTSNLRLHRQDKRLHDNRIKSLNIPRNITFTYNTIETLKNPFSFSISAQ